MKLKRGAKRLFKEYGQPLKTADGVTILRLSGIVSYCLSGNHSSIQTQMQPSEDIWRTAVLFVTAQKLQISCTKWIFCFQPHADGGYEQVSKNTSPVQLDLESSKLIKDLIHQYQTMKKKL